MTEHRNMGDHFVIDKFISLTGHNQIVVYQHIAKTLRLNDPDILKGAVFVKKVFFVFKAYI